MKYFLVYTAVAYLVTFIITLIRTLHFFYKFRVVNAKEVVTVIIMIWAPHLLFFLLTFPLEVASIIVNKRIIDPRYAYEIACGAFNMDYQMLHFAYRIRHYEKVDLEDI